jgi:glycosyltransferase involved in cell wall biosynthesis
VENRDFVTALDPAALAQAIVALGRDAPLRATVGAANRAKAEVDFDQQAMLAAYASLFDGIALFDRAALFDGIVPPAAA